MEGGSTVVEVEVSVDATEIALIVIPGKCHCGNLSFTAFEGIDPGLSRRAQGFALAGALLFAVSDGLLALKLFVRPLPGSGYAIMLCYWAAQWCIAVSAREPRQSGASRALQAGGVGSSA